MQEALSVMSKETLHDRAPTSFEALLVLQLHLKFLGELLDYRMKFDSNTIAFSFT